MLQNKSYHTLQKITTKEGDKIETICEMQGGQILKKKE